MDRISQPVDRAPGSRRQGRADGPGRADRGRPAKERHIPHAYLVFDGEGHGFRQAANIRRALEAELSFYAQVFGFELADSVEPIEVEFLA